MDERLTKRFKIIYIIIGIVFVLICWQLYRLQVIQGSDYRILAENRLLTTEAVKAPRGEIFDRNGIPLVTNRIGFGVSFRKEFIKEDKLNNLIFSVIKIFRKTGDGYTDTFPVTMQAPYTYIFSGASTKETEIKQSRFLKDLGLPTDTSPTALIDFYAKKYKVSKKLSDRNKRAVVGVRYEMENRMFSNNNPYTFSTDVGMETVTILKENSSSLQGISVTVDPIREYTHPSMASHLLGRVGVISKEEYDSKTKSGKTYRLNDTIGKDGIEAYLEDYLKGKDGTSAIYKNTSGILNQTISESNPETGNYAVLTIDAKLQQVLEDSLASTIADIQQTYSDAQSGAAVVMDVKNGDVLAMASYPTYNIDSFNEDYQDLVENPNHPLWNRAVGGAYAPGSTFKMVTAIAALSEGVVSEAETIDDTGIYEYYDDYQPKCWASEQGGHGEQNLTQALANSCNYYFYDVGRRLGINNIEKYARMFGLGEKTGIELPGEISGVTASKKHRKETGGTWYPGDTLQAAIGQSDHMFTPVQIASYISTLANGGTRYAPHILKNVNDYSDDSKILTIEPEVELSLELDPYIHKAVMQGMLNVAEEGTAADIFDGYGIKVGCKTGTATVSSGNDNGIFVAFAPYDDPQIAVVSVIEHGGHGSSLGAIAKAVFDQYLMADPAEDKIIQRNTLIP